MAAGRDGIDQGGMGHGNGGRAARSAFDRMRAIGGFLGHSGGLFAAAPAVNIGGLVCRRQGSRRGQTDQTGGIGAHSAYRPRSHPDAGDQSAGADRPSCPESAIGAGISGRRHSGDNAVAQRRQTPLRQMQPLSIAII
jgi:hypothetical protein